MSRFVVDRNVILYLLQEDQSWSSAHKVLAPTLARSEVLDALYGAVRRGELTDEVGRRRLARFAKMKIRYLGDKVLRQRAWNLAAELGLSSTRQAEYLALTQLQADGFVTLDNDFARAAAGIVEIVPLENLLSSQQR